MNRQHTVVTGLWKEIILFCLNNECAKYNKNTENNNNRNVYVYVFNLLHPAFSVMRLCYVRSYLDIHHKTRKYKPCLHVQKSIINIFKGIIWKMLWISHCPLEVDVDDVQWYLFLLAPGYMQALCWLHRRPFLLHEQCVFIFTFQLTYENRVWDLGELNGTSSAKFNASPFWNVPKPTD